MAETLEERLAHPQLKVAMHLGRNAWTAVGVVIVSVSPPLLLHFNVSPWLFVLSPAQAASFVDSALALVPPLPNTWPLTEIKFLGWLLLPTLFAWWGVALERSTDGKLDSTRKQYMDHLKHEAEAAKLRMLKQNLELHEAEEISQELREIEPKQRHARRLFALRQHDLVAVFFWPWFIASALLIVAVGSIPFIFSPIIELQNMGGLIGGHLVVLATIYRKARRWERMRIRFWYIRDFFRQAARGNVSGAAPL